VGERWRGGWLRIERKGGRRAGLIKVEEMFLDCGDLKGVSVGGVARGVFCNSSFSCFPFSRFLVFFSPFPPLYHVDVDLLTSFFCSTDIKNGKAC